MAMDSTPRSHGFVNNFSGKKIEQVSAWATYHIILYNTILSVISILLVVSTFLFTSYQYFSSQEKDRALKDKEIEISTSQNQQKRFDNAFSILAALGDNAHTKGAYAELAAIKELEQYKEYHAAYVYMLQRYVVLAQNAKPEDKTMYDAYLEGLRRLVDNTDKNNH